MPLKVWDGSAFTMAGQVHVWNGSSWVQTKAGKVWNGSAWVQFHPGVTLEPYGDPADIVLAAQDIVTNPPSVTASASTTITLDSNGTATYQENSGGSIVDHSFSWLLSGANSDYYAFMDTPSGGSFSSGSVSSALQLNTTRQWILSRLQIGSGVQSASLTSTLKIRTASGVVIVSIPISMSIYVEVS